MCREISGDRAELRLTRGYVHLCHAPADDYGAKTVSLARFGNYEVRLVEFVRTRPADATPMWLELYSHETQLGIDSCCCYDLEEAVHATEDFISRARELDEESRGMNYDAEGAKHGGRAGRGLPPSTMKGWSEAVGRIGNTAGTPPRPWQPAERQRQPFGCCAG